MVHQAEDRRVVSVQYQTLHLPGAVGLASVNRYLLAAILDYLAVPAAEDNSRGATSNAQSPATTSSSMRGWPCRGLVGKNYRVDAKPGSTGRALVRTDVH